MMQNGGVSAVHADFIEHKLSGNLSLAVRFSAPTSHLDILASGNPTLHRASAFPGSVRRAPRLSSG